MSLQIPILIPKDKSTLSKAYISKKLVGHILIICKNVQRENKRLNTLLIAAYRHDKVLNRELITLVEEKEFC